MDRQPSSDASHTKLEHINPGEGNGKIDGIIKIQTELEVHNQDEDSLNDL
jgi:hypothetical protein